MKDQSNCSHVKEPLYQYVKDNYWYIFRGNTAILSSTCRQLALGIGVAILVNNIDKVKLSSSKWTFTLLTLFFIFDAIHYLYQSLAFKKLAEGYDRDIKDGKITDILMLDEPEYIRCIANALFFLKLVMLAFAASIFIYKIWS